MALLKGLLVALVPLTSKNPAGSVCSNDCADNDNCDIRVRTVSRAILLIALNNRCISISFTGTAAISLDLTHRVVLADIANGLKHFSLDSLRHSSDLFDPVRID